MGRQGSKSLPVLDMTGYPAGRRKEKGLSPKLCWAERGCLAGEPKIASLLRRGCRRALTRSTANYLGGHGTDTEQHGFTDADLGKAAAAAGPTNNSVTSEHLIMPKGARTACRTSCFNAELESNQHTTMASPWSVAEAQLGGWRWKQDGIFQFVALPLQGCCYLHWASLSLAECRLNKG